MKIINFQKWRSHKILRVNKLILLLQGDKGVLTHLGCISYRETMSPLKRRSQIPTTMLIWFISIRLGSSDLKQTWCKWLKKSKLLFNMKTSISRRVFIEITLRNHIRFILAILKILLLILEKVGLLKVIFTLRSEQRPFHPYLGQEKNRKIKYNMLIKWAHQETTFRISKRDISQVLTGLIHKEIRYLLIKTLIIIQEMSILLEKIMNSNNKNKLISRMTTSLHRLKPSTMVTAI